MDTKNIITFKTITEMGSFKAAAIKLNYAQSTVTTQIQQLEQEFNVKLFDKIGRRVILTEAGNDFLVSVNQLLNTYDAMKSYSKRDTLSGDLRIAVPESILTYKLQTILKEFHENAPEVRLYLKTLNCFKIPYEVEKGYSDLGIYYDVGLKNEKIIETHLWSDDISVIAGKNLTNTKIDFTIHDVSYDTCVLSNDSDSIYQKLFEEMISRKKISFTHMIEAGSIESIKRSVVNNLGVAVFPSFVFEEEFKNKTVKKISSELDKEKIDTIYSYHVDRWMPPSAKYFIELLNKK